MASKGKMNTELNMMMKDVISNYIKVLNQYLSVRTVQCHRDILHRGSLVSRAIRELDTSLFYFRRFTAVTCFGVSVTSVIGCVFEDLPCKIKQRVVKNTCLFFSHDRNTTEYTIV